jgi:hypothetical protein
LYAVMACTIPDWRHSTWNPAINHGLILYAGSDSRQSVPKQKVT